ncbi:radical SAM protein [Ignicoccus hospitalis]|uniref:Radical SAM domain protein n=1 Tax=Ignicoccus hospitalis (strain KIN4/I / DSM 18386 / JCM 14125) TaxID=453591 RepID=A8ABG1_IGNH4|nr:radical SAM protein [Ignicoccus hospitalis]ABU82263.1 Radical SAM domain protein [Ignicoccus hospitalis KIN4/I]
MSAPKDPPSFSEALDLWHYDLYELGMMAEDLRKKTVGDVVTFVANYNINYTNVCVYRCPLCAFYKEKGEEGAYFLSVEEMLKQAAEAVWLGATELHVVGGIIPELTVEYFEKFFSEVKRRWPFLTIKALTATEVSYLARINRMSVKEVLERLKEAGLDAMPGGGAEVLDDEVLKVIAPAKSAEEWLRTIETAHELGIRTNATMLYGHVERPEHIIRHLMRIRELQEKTGGFLTFILLKFKPKNTELWRKGLVKHEAPAPYDAKVVAISRIVLNGFINNISVYWVGYGKKYASALLNFGGSDLVGTAFSEKIFRSAEAHDGYATLEELAHYARTSGRVPAQRDTFFNIIRYL